MVCVEERDGYSKAAKLLMLLSAETRLGLRITGMTLLLLTIDLSHGLAYSWNFEERHSKF